MNKEVNTFNKSPIIYLLTKVRELVAARLIFIFQTPSFTNISFLDFNKVIL